MKQEQRVLVTVSARPSSAPSFDFVKFVEGELAGLQRYTLSDQERAKDYFSISLGLDAIDEVTTAVSVAVGFHERSSDADYFLQHWAGHFLNSECEAKAKLLVSAINEEIERRIGQGWLAKQPTTLQLSPNPDVIRTVAKRLAAAFWSFFRDDTFDDALATVEAEFGDNDDEGWITLADHLTWHLLKGIGEKQPNLKKHVQ